MGELSYEDLLLEGAADGLFLHDDRFRFIAVTPSAPAMFGYSRQELMGMGLEDLEPDFNRHGIGARLTRLAHGESLVSEGQPARKDGSRLWVEVRVTALDDSGRRFYVAAVRDITARRQALDALKQAEAALRRSGETLERQLQELRHHLVRVERQASLGTVAAAVGHELSNIASVIVMSGDEIREDADAGRAPDAECVANLVRAGEHVATHARHLLHLGRPGPTTPEPVELGGLVRDTLAMLRHSGRTRHAQDLLELPDSDRVVLGSRTRLEQALINVVCNAADAVSGTGITAPRIRLSVRQGPRRGTVLVAVADNGPGIDPDQRDRIFEPFFTTKGPDDGTGLGLSVVRQIVDGLGGELDVSSGPEQGTIFSIVLPLLDEGAGPG